MPRVEVDETYDSEGRVISSKVREISDDEIARLEARGKLNAIPNSAFVPPWGPIVLDILRILGIK